MSESSGREPIDQYYEGKNLEQLREDVLDVNDPTGRAGLAEKAERIARAFHEAYEQFAPEFGYKTRTASAVPWEDVPQQNRSLMVATVRSLLERGVIA